MTVIGLSSVDNPDLRKLPMSRWFLAPHMLLESETNAVVMKPIYHPGFGYRGAWKMRQKVMPDVALSEAERGVEW